MCDRWWSSLMLSPSLSRCLCGIRLSDGWLPVCVSVVFSACCFRIHRSLPSAGRVTMYRCTCMCVCGFLLLTSKQHQTDPPNTTLMPLFPLLTPHLLHCPSSHQSLHLILTSSCLLSCLCFTCFCVFTPVISSFSLHHFPLSWKLPCLTSSCVFFLIFFLIMLFFPPFTLQKK